MGDPNYFNPDTELYGHAKADEPEKAAEPENLLPLKIKVPLYYKLIEDFAVFQVIKCCVKHY